MTHKASTPDEYVAALPDEQRPHFVQLRQVISENIPPDFEECILYNMLTWAVPKSIYPKGYHCDPKLPLMFVSIAGQKNFIALYHMGIYMMPELLDWFVSEFPKHSKAKLDMGKSCIRFKKTADIPFDLIGQLMRRVSVDQYLEVYESNLNLKR